MSHFPYTNLEDLGSPSDKPWAIKMEVSPEATDCMSQAAARNSVHADDLENRLGAEAATPKPDKSWKWRSKQENTKYKAMKPTSVKELPEHDIEGQGQHKNVDFKRGATLTDKKQMSISKVHIAICCLLITSVVLVAFTVIYVFIILPAYQGKIINPDGRTSSIKEAKGLSEDVVVTSCGYVRGKKEQGAFVFRGIPYAVPPTSSQRWKPPAPRSTDTGTCWNGVYNAFKFGSKCVQPKVNNNSAIDGSEDCLFINVWTPSVNPQAPLPVMVWFHSGDFVYGSGHMPGMSPSSEVAMATNAVYVSFNYRLGAFGFLALDELRETSRGPAGNYGFMDQQLALTWVKENIRHFGGNENMVTIFGHGSGATSIHVMLSSSGSSGLFHKAWLTSPVTVINKTVDEACKDNRLFLKNTGCQDARCLRQLSADVVSSSSPWSLKAHWTLEQLFSIPHFSQLRNDLPIFDGHVVHWSSQKSGPEGPVVPIILGSTYFDMSSLETEESVVNMTWKDYENLMSNLSGIMSTDAVEKVKSVYSKKQYLKYIKQSKFPSTAGVQLSHIIEDIRNVCPVKILADNFVYLYSGSAPVYMYVVEMYPTENNKHAGSEREAFVGWDIAAFFDGFQDLNFKISQGEVNFQNIIREEIMNFVKMNHPDALRWETADVNIGIFSHDVAVTPVTSEYFSQCSLWKQYEFFKYTWNKS